MARLARAEVFAPDEVAIVHVMNRVVRRCFLLGTDTVTGINYDHRKAWIEEQLQRMAAYFGIDLLGFAILKSFPFDFEISTGCRCHVGRYPAQPDCTRWVTGSE